MTTTLGNARSKRGAIHTKASKQLTIEGGASCDAGSVNIRLFTGESNAREFPGFADGLVKGHAPQGNAFTIHGRDQEAVRSPVGVSGGERSIVRPWIWLVDNSALSSRAMSSSWRG